MSTIKELFKLIKMLFSSKPSDFTESLIEQMKHFPFKGYTAMSWCGKIITRKDPSLITDTTKRHETIHLKLAQLKKSWVKFYWSYFVQWLKGNPIISPSISAYYTIPYEVEAYANQNDLGDYKVTKESIKKYTLKKRKSTYKAHRSNWKEWIKTL